MKRERRCPACGGELLSGHFVHGPKIVLTTRRGAPLPVVGDVCARCGRVEVRVEDVEALHGPHGHEHGVQEADF